MRGSGRPLAYATRKRPQNPQEKHRSCIHGDMTGKCDLPRFRVHTGCFTVHSMIGRRPRAVTLEHLLGNHAATGHGPRSGGRHGFGGLIECQG